MVKAEVNKLSDEERVQALASEIAIRAIYDLRLLQRRKVLIGDRLAPKPYPRLTDCCCYREEENINKLLDDFKNGTVLFWCRMGGAEIDQSNLNKLLKKGAEDVD